MRIWDVPPFILCRQHLLGEHRELHALRTILTEDRRGYARRPETQRWRGKLAALYARREQLVVEMQRLGYRHGGPLDPRLATGLEGQRDYVDTPAAQLVLLRGKGRGCAVGIIEPAPT